MRRFCWFVAVGGLVGGGSWIEAFRVQAAFWRLFLGFCWFRLGVPTGAGSPIVVWWFCDGYVGLCGVMLAVWGCCLFG